MTDTAIAPNGLPLAQGLYDPANEHDACGVGFLANIKGVKTHATIRRGIQILENLHHRGAVGADPLDGDGAGILIQVPDALYRATVPFKLPITGDYGTGLVFLPRDEDARRACMEAVEQAVAHHELKLLGWREVPTNNRTLGRVAKGNEPAMRQVFIGRGQAAPRQFELQLYLARKRAENLVRTHQLAGNGQFYVCSLSSKTIVYKGMFLAHTLGEYFPDLGDERAVSALALVHQRYSTNTFPTWDLAHPFRLVAHNGEINTLRGNINRMRAREALLAHRDIGEAVQDLKPVIIEGGSDTACFDNALEFLLRTGRSLPHAMAMMVPSAWSTKANLPRHLKGFYEYHATMMEPWDGPANLVACDGERICAALDRNGLRPARYVITTDDEILYASEMGTLDIAPEKIAVKSRLAPGKMIMVDTARGVFLEDEAIKDELAKGHPYADWIEEHKITLDQLPAPVQPPIPRHEDIRQQQAAFGYTLEDLKVVMHPMCVDGQEAVGSMGDDTPVAVLSDRPKPLYNYFKQLFAQVTNPPIDPIREEIVMSLTQYVGPARNILEPTPQHCKMLEIDQPILSNEALEQLRQADIDGFRGATLDCTFPADKGPAALESRLEELFAEAERVVEAGRNVLVLSDRKVGPQRAPIPALLAVSAIHHHLIRAGKRTQCSLVCETGEPREVHHFALLVGYGATAINPYLAFESIHDLVDTGMLPALDGNKAADEEHDATYHYTKNYTKAVGKGLLKVFSKMGISTLQSYCSAQIFEAVGLSSAFIDKYFARTPSRIGGAGVAEIAEETLRRHVVAFSPSPDKNRDIDRGGYYHWRRDGEYHLMNPEVIALLQHAVRNQDKATYQRYARLVNDQARNLCTLRGLFKFKAGSPIPLDQVESVESITRRFVTGAMSLGSISTEAHEAMAIAMNQLGGRSNTGEGGEDPRRFAIGEDGLNRRSAIKQVASGRFGVTPHYLVNADELQIKMAQGAKPGEGGQLPGHKVSEYIGWLRHTTPGVTLISPPPHHDIYSIEDLAQLIFDLKNANPAAKISVKLVSEVGVGTVAAGVAKAHADLVTISGAEGGTGASPISSIKHAGIPWELGLAETHQTLVLNDLRSRIKVQTDGLLRTGRDVVVAALLGAEEFGFATVALISMGCIMMRKCHLNTCPVGIATQDEALRKRFAGKPEHVVNYMRFVAEEAREVMASLGLRTLDEAVGRTELLEMNEAIKHWKSKGLDYSKMLQKPKAGAGVQTRCCIGQDHGIEQVRDRELIRLAAPALERRDKVVIELPIRNRDRTFGAMLSGEVARRHGRDGLPAGTIDIRLTGVAGQSFGAFLHHGINITLVGDGNDYVGKGMHGGRIVIHPHAKTTYAWDANAIVGNTVLYGATGGECYLAGRAGERFAVRNSGCRTVIEGVGDHGCEYMTGGHVVVLGSTGRNFAAGMSGGIAWVHDEDRTFAKRCNMGMVDLEQVTPETTDADLLRQLVANHVELTGSAKAKRLLADWPATLKKFVKVFPREYRRVLQERAERARKAAAQPVAAK
ncbi:MAG: glutamate synthase large subunit [Planctomycetes bacterium]|nr:glutamate synthase large subunit [Planctomycetota bacterium]